MLKLKDLNKFNVHGLGDRPISQRSGLSYPAVRNYLGRGYRKAGQPSLPHIAMLLQGMGVLDWRSVTLGELLEDDGDDDTT